MFLNLGTVIILPGLDLFTDKELYNISVKKNNLSGENKSARFTGDKGKSKDSGEGHLNDKYFLLIIRFVYFTVDGKIF